MQKLSSIEDAECSQPASSLPAPMFLPLGSPLPTIYDALTNQDGKERNKEPSALPILRQERRQDMNHKKEGRMLTYFSKPSRFLPSLPSRLTSSQPSASGTFASFADSSKFLASRFPFPWDQTLGLRKKDPGSVVKSRYSNKETPTNSRPRLGSPWFRWSDFPLSLPFIRPLDSILSHTRMLT